ncbi:MAG: hypothetical protein ACM3ZB_16540 [bacterium]|jgi:hypothetical protein
MRAAALALACVALCGCGSRDARIHRSLERLVPGDASMLAGIRGDRLRDTPGWSARGRSLMRSALPDEAAARDAGLDLERDIDEALLVWDGVHFIGLARGRFDGRTGERLGAGEGSAIFLDESTLAAGSREDVAWLLAERGRMAGPPAALKKLMGELPPESHAWLVAIGGRAPDVRGNAANFAQVLTAAESVWAALSFDRDARLSAKIVANSDKEAATLEGGLSALAALARVSARDAAAAKAIEGIRIERQDRVVTIEAAFTPEQVDGLVK